MTITRRGLADEIDRLDDEIAGYQTDKAEIFKAYRGQLEADGMAKPDIAVEVTAIKAAIRRRRAMEDDPRAVETKDALIDEIYVEISGASQRGTSIATRARASRAKARMSESMADTAELAREMADEGLISREAAEETTRIAEAAAKKFGNGSSDGNGTPPPASSPPPQSAPPVPAAAQSVAGADPVSGSGPGAGDPASAALDHPAAPGPRPFAYPDMPAILTRAQGPPQAQPP